MKTFLKRISLPALLCVTFFLNTRNAAAQTPDEIIALSKEFYTRYFEALKQVAGSSSESSALAISKSAIIELTPKRDAFTTKYAAYAKTHTQKEADAVGKMVQNQIWVKNFLKEYDDPVLAAKLQRYPSVSGVWTPFVSTLMSRLDAVHFKGDED